MHRTFIAVDLPETIRTQLACVRRQIDDECGDIHWVSEDKLHITVGFLGDVTSEVLSAVCEAMARTAEVMYPLEFSLPAVGLFPLGKTPRMLWAAVDDYRSDLLSLHEAAYVELKRFGFSPEHRTYRPHVTLGRIKRVWNGPRLAKRMAHMVVPPSEAITAETLGVYTSELRPTGARYTEVAKLKLGR